MTRTIHAALIIWTIFLVLTISPYASAQAGHSHDSPRLIGISGFEEIRMSSSDDLDATINKYIAPSLRESLGDDGVVDLIEDLRATLADATLRGARPVSEFTASVSYESKTSPAGTLLLTVEPEPPHRITALGFTPAGASERQSSGSEVSRASARRAAAKFIRAINKRPEGYVAANLSPRMRKKYGDAGILSLMRELVANAELDFAKTRLVNVSAADEGVWDVLVEDPVGDRYKLDLFLTGNDPALVDGFGLEVALVPGEIARDEIDDAIAAFVERRAAAGRFSGAVLVARDGKPIASKVVGLADRSTGRKNTLDTPINLGSMNKMFTGLATAQLVRQGMLDWNDTVGEHLPDYPNPTVRERVTIHQLLTHTSGIPSYWNDVFDEKKNELVTLEDFLSTFLDEPLDFEPGTDNRYSNGGPVLLGLIIEAVTGESYYDYVRDHIYAPAGMDHSGHYLMTDDKAGFAIGYHRESPDSPFMPNNEMLGNRGSAAGGGYASANDLLRFARALASETLLPREWLEKLWSPQMKRSEEFGYGYLWGTGRVNGKRWVGHNGGAPGVNADFRYFPDENLTVIVLANQSQAAMAISDWIVELITRD